MANKKNKKRKRRLNREQLRQTLAPTHDFEFINPYDEDDIIMVTAQRLSPGHLLEMDSSSLIKAYQRNPSEDDTQASGSPSDSDVAQDILDNFDTVINNVKHAAEIASISIIDPDTGERIYTKEDCMAHLLPEWNTKIANWALAGALPQEGGNADDVDRFPPGSDEQEEPEVQAEAG